VFKEGDSYYMIPESRAAGEVRLYKSVSFPMQWKFEKTLLRGQFVDSSLVRFRNTWWLFSGVSPYSLSIFYADSFRGPWKPHALNPVYRADSSRARPAGRPVVQNGELIRFVQDNREGYGKKVRAMNQTPFLLQRVRDGARMECTTSLHLSNRIVAGLQP
jgi:hypothetical protein